MQSNLNNLIDTLTSVLRNIDIIINDYKGKHGTDSQYVVLHYSEFANAIRNILKIYKKDNSFTINL